jgi:hypothetical protein
MTLDETRVLFMTAAISSTLAWVLSLRVQMPPTAVAYFAKQAGLYATFGCVIAYALKKHPEHKDVPLI